MSLPTPESRRAITECSATTYWLIGVTALMLAAFTAASIAWLAGALPPGSLASFLAAWREESVHLLSEILVISFALLLVIGGMLGPWLLGRRLAAVWRQVRQG